MSIGAKTVPFGAVEGFIHYVEMLAGKDAYRLAVEKGFEGTEDDWLEYLKGESAYQLAVSQGYDGTLDDWLKSLKGEKGDKGDAPVKGVDYFTDADKAEFANKVESDLANVLDAKANKVHTHTLSDITDYTAYDDSEVKKSISDETTERKSSDETLQKNIDTKANQTDLDSLSSDLDTLQKAYNTEASTRELADTALTNLINTEVQNRIKADSELSEKISAIPKFAIEVVNELPTSDISVSTVYLLKTSDTETGNLYTEYIYVNNAWEKLGTQTLDLSDYYHKNEVNTLLNTKQNTLTAGNNITIADNTISAKDTVYDDTAVKQLISTETTERKAEVATKADAKHTHVIADITDYDIEDGFSPIVTVSKADGITTLSITDKEGVKTATISDGAQGIQGEKGETGASGKDGVSPTLTTSKADGVTTITITDSSGTKTASIADGAKGDKGDTGATGEKGADGYTPIKGTDYFTDADKTEIVNAVLAQVVDGTEVEY